MVRLAMILGEQQQCNGMQGLVKNHKQVKKKLYDIHNKYYEDSLWLDNNEEDV